ncbi:MAG: M6 family metalloprotease domain-containing protein [Paludibacteraceae bacterium]|nr:M6 family metalloprotease domain-containing protein [Paludibacteraceae bacterium]
MKHTFLTLSLIAVAMTVMAKPAYRGPITRTQADGTTITVYQHGDEFFHYLTDAQGQWLQMDADGMYRPAPALSEQEITTRRMASPKFRLQRKLAVGERNIAPRGLVILVNFKDLSFKTPKAEMDSMHTGMNYTRNYSYSYYGDTYRVTSSGSARQYFYETSWGQYNPQFDVVGPVTVSQKMEYYGANDGNGDDVRPEVMVQEACKLADTQYNINFAQYDNNNDGYVDFVYVVYAGYGEADGGATNTIWPHSWHLTSGNINLRLDNKIVDLYACGAELSSISDQHDGIGTFCHEFSHVMGLPDLYSTNNATHKTMGQWDIMDYGPYNNDGNTPPFYSAYERWFMGWMTPAVLSKEAADITLNPIHTSREALLISSTGAHNLDGLNPSPATFWLLENRQQTGWDKYLPGHGMLMTKIQYSASKWEENTVNNSSMSMGVDIIEADGKTPTYNESNPENGYSGKAKDLFPAGATSYTKINGYSITSIAEQNSIITFKMNGGGGSETPPTPQPGGGCEAYAYEYTAKPEIGNDVDLNNYLWDITVTNDTYLSKDVNNRGAQFGSSSQPAQNVTFTTDEVAGCLINQVTVNAAMGSRGDAKLAVYIGSTQIGATKSLTTASTDYVFSNTGKLTGNLSIVFTNSAKAIYVKNINITYSATTAMDETIETKDQARKFLRDGRLVIRANGVEYDVTGAVLR